MKQRKVPRLTDELKKQKIDDIFKEFYRLEEILNSNEWYAQSFISIRLVTIIEQFFRQIVMIQLNNSKMQPPGEIVLKTQDLSNINSVTPEFVISTSYHCQNVDQLETILQQTNLPKVIPCLGDSGVTLDDFAELFNMRHDIVHTVSLQTKNLTRYHQLIEMLMICVLDSTFYEHAFLLYKGNAYAQLNRFSEALTQYNTLESSMAVISFQLYHNKGLTLAALDRHGEALACFDEAIQLEPNESKAHNNKGNMLAALGRHDEALACFDEAIQLDPNEFKAYNNKGVSLANLLQYNKALACFDETIQLEPNESKAHNNKGHLLATLGRHDEALACFDEAIRLKPDDAGAHYNKGISLADLHRYDQALACFDEAIRLEPDDSDAHYNKGSLLADLHRYDQALVCFDEVIRLKPDDTDAYNNKGASLAALDRQDEALVCFDEVIRLKPEIAEAHYNKGVSLAALDRHDEALACFDEAIRLKPDDTDAQHSKLISIRALNGSNDNPSEA